MMIALEIPRSTVKIEYLARIPGNFKPLVSINISKYLARIPENFKPLVSSHIFEYLARIPTGF